MARLGPRNAAKQGVKKGLGSGVVQASVLFPCPFRFVSLAHRQKWPIMVTRTNEWEGAGRRGKCRILNCPRVEKREKR